MRLKLLTLATTLAFAFAGCSTKNKEDTASEVRGGTLNPPPAQGERDSLESQLKRFEGQTEFLNPYGWGGYDDEFSADASATAEGGLENAKRGSAEKRDVQESDIFKVGKEGSNLLYLLNNYRGLQVVSYEDGPNQPKLLGRVEATRNWAQDMYYDQAHDRLFVLENNYYDNDSDRYNYNNKQSRLLVYSVKDPANPSIVRTLDLKGEIAESRMVGDVLYVATATRPSWRERREGNNNGSGQVFSIDVSKEEVAFIASYELSHPVSRRENMNIVEQVKDGRYFYYLVAVLSESGWGWWDNQSVIEVVDISDPKGQVLPLMKTTSKGMVNERSQTFIKDDTLIVTSNYLPADAANRLRRIAVETFTFPGEESQIIDAEEFEFRQMYIKRELQRERDRLEDSGISEDEIEDRYDEAVKKITADPEFGVAGFFVKDNATLKKAVADSFVSVGSTQGLSANLQDVRYQDELLYAFWVPQNNIDPLDVFDMSSPREGIKHLEHLEFDGWIQRAIPVTYKNKKYIIGLGYVIPSTDERNRRFPQVMLFEVKKGRRGGVKAEVVDQINLMNSRTWANFNAADKFIDVRFTGDGVGRIMFTFSSWGDSQYRSGGKLIGFDLNAAETDDQPIFQEGGALVADTGWLRRVFNNPEVDRINTFSDQALGTFDMGDGVGGAKDFVDAVNILELARNIESYITITKSNMTRGIQVVRHSRSWYDAETEFRLVNGKKADAELGEVLSTYKLEGRYMTHEQLDDGRVLVLTRVEKQLEDSRWERSYNLVLLDVRGRGLKSLEAVATKSWKHEDQSRNYYSYNLQQFVNFDGAYYLNIDRVIHKLDVDKYGINVSPVVVSNCEWKSEEDEQGKIKRSGFGGDYYYGYRNNDGLKLVGGKLVFESMEIFTDEKSNLRYSRNFVAPIKVGYGDLTTEFTCGDRINIPGTLLAWSGDSMITEDRRLIGIHQREGSRYKEFKTENVISGLKLKNAAAGLMDLYDPENVQTYSMKFVDDMVIFVESAQAQSSYYWDSPYYYEDDYGYYPRYNNNSENKLSFVKLDDSGRFVKESYILDMNKNASVSLMEIMPTSQAGQYYMFLKSGNKMGVYTIAGMSSKPEPVKLQKVEADGSLSDASHLVPNYSYYGSYYWSSGVSNINYTSKLNSIEIPNGLYGVQQYFIAE